MIGWSNPLVKLFIAVLVLALWSSCSDDVDGRGTSCPVGESLNAITGECQPVRCGPGERINTVTGACEATAPGMDAGFDLDGSNTPDGDDGPDTESPHCPLGDCDAGVIFPDTGGHDPFQPQSPGEIEYHSCSAEETANLTPPRFITSRRANYLLALPPAMSATTVSIPARQLHAHFFEHAQRHLTGFVVSLGPRPEQHTPASIGEHILSTTRAIPSYAAATSRSVGRPYMTHDHFSAQINGLIELPGGTEPHVARDTIMARLMGLSPGDFQHDLTTTFDGDATPTIFAYKIVRRSNQQYILVGAFATASRYDDPDLSTGILVDDLVGGTALAMAEETMTDECISYTIRDTNEVDIIISLDASGSMDEVQNALSGFAQQFTELLDAAGVDWRIGVTGVDCDEIKTDEALSREFRDLWPESTSSGGIFGDIMAICKEPTIIGGGSTGNNGRLIGGGFTRDFNQISQRMNQVSRTGLEYTLTMGMAAIDHSLPRADDAINKIRTNAAVVLVAVTDENEQLFKDKFSWISGSSSTITAQQRLELETFAQPWIDFLSRPDINAPVYGLYWVPGQPCAGATDVAHGIHHIVERTGGQGDSVCQPDVTNAFRDIADATRDLSSGLRLVGTPVAASIRVDVEDVETQAISPLNRSRIDGFDFHSYNNSLFFEGPSAPQLEQRVIVPYLRWNRTVFPCVLESDCPDNMKCNQGICG
ncbi:MAG: hypothetical protein ACNA8W_07100 [Bradymonadaceae bacterium]